MSFFVFVNDDGTRNQAYLNAMREETLQRLGLCYLCNGIEKADTWIRNLSSKNSQGGYDEYLIGEKCRGIHGIPIPEWYSRFSLMGNDFESLPFTKDTNCHVARTEKVSEDV